MGDDSVLVLGSGSLLDQYGTQRIATFLKWLTSLFPSYITHVGKKKVYANNQSHMENIAMLGSVFLIFILTSMEARANMLEMSWTFFFIILLIDGVIVSYKVHVFCNGNISVIQSKKRKIDRIYIFFVFILHQHH
jgi:hypothetical protein